MKLHLNLCIPTYPTFDLSDLSDLSDLKKFPRNFVLFYLKSRLVFVAYT